MGLLPKQNRDPSVSLVAYALAVGVPLAAYVATASPHAYWLDAGELVEAAVALDIAHPPGHPLASLVGHVLTFVPLGPLSLRVALAQALCAAIAAGFLFRAIDTTVRAMEVRHDRLAIPIALFAERARELAGGGRLGVAQRLGPARCVGIGVDQRRRGVVPVLSAHVSKLLNEWKGARGPRLYAPAQRCSSSAARRGRSWVSGPAARRAYAPEASPSGGSPSSASREWPFSTSDVICAAKLTSGISFA